MKLLGSLILRPLGRDLLRTVLYGGLGRPGCGGGGGNRSGRHGATGSFHSSIQSLAGRTTWKFSPTAACDEYWIARLTALPLNAKFSPVIERRVFLREVGSVPIYGADMLGGPPGGGIVVSRAIADRLGVAKGGSVSVLFHGKWRPFTVGEIVDAHGAEFLALDIAKMEHALGQYGKLDRIDVVVPPGEDFARVEREIRATVPPSYLIEKPGVRSDENQRMLRAFRWNLRILSYISLVVGRVSDLQHDFDERGAAARGNRHPAGPWDQPRRCARAVSGRGADAGRRRARPSASRWAACSRACTVRFIGDDRQRALHHQPAGARVADVWRSGPRDSGGRGGGGGLGVRAGPRSHGGGSHGSDGPRRPRAPRAAALAARAGMGSGARSARGGGFSGTCPWAAFRPGDTRRHCSLWPPPRWRHPRWWWRRTALTRPLDDPLGAEGLLAGRSLAASLSRTSVVVAALATAIAMMASVGIMVGSFRETVLLWLDKQLRADLYRAGRRARPAPAITRRIPAAVPGLLASTPGVAAVDVFRALRVPLPAASAPPWARAISDDLRRYGRLRFLPGRRPRCHSALAAGPRPRHRQRALRQQARRARRATPRPPARRRATSHLTVAGIYYDYSSSQGYVCWWTAPRC